MTPSSIRQVTRTAHGSEVQQPVIVGDEVIFVQRSGRKIRTFRYDFNVDGFLAEDLTYLSEHLTEEGVKEMTYAQEPDSLIYAVMDNGDMMIGTYIREQSVIGWTRYTTDGSYESVATVTNNAVDDVYVVVNRNINGATARYIELLETGNGSDRLHGYSDSFLTYSSFATVTGITQANPAVVTTSAAHGFSNGDDIKLIDVVGMTQVNNVRYLVANVTSTTFELTDANGNNVDSTSYTAYTSGGEAHELVNTISGLTHLEGKTVQVKADGASHANKTVSSGAITLDRNSYEVVVGLSYTTTIETLSQIHKLGVGPLKGQQSRFVRPILEVYKSIPPLVNNEFIPSRTPADSMDASVPLKSGYLFYGSLNWDEDANFTFTTSEPFPFLLSGIFGSINIGIR